MNTLNNQTMNTVQVSAMRRSVAVLVMHFYNFDKAPDFYVA